MTSETSGEESNFNFDTIPLFLERAHQLGQETVKFAQQLSSDSLQVLLDNNSPAIHHTGEIRWPLSNDHLNQVGLIDREYRRLSMAYPGHPPIRSNDIVDKNTIAVEGYKVSALERVYQFEEEPIVSFIKDLRAWANGMAEKDWKLLLKIHVPDEDQIQVYLYQDNPEIRNYFKNGQTMDEEFDAELEGRGEYEFGDRISVIGPDRLIASLGNAQ